jgi:hypothetical protein
VGIKRRCYIMLAGCWVLKDLNARGRRGERTRALGGCRRRTQSRSVHVRPARTAMLNVLHQTLARLSSSTLITSTAPLQAAVDKTADCAATAGTTTSPATVTPTMAVYDTMKEPTVPNVKYSPKDAIEDVPFAYHAINLFVTSAMVESQEYVRRADPRVCISSPFVHHSVQFRSTIAKSLPFPPRVLSYSSRSILMLTRSMIGCLSSRRRRSSDPHLAQHPSTVPSCFLHPDSTSESQSASTPPSTGILTKSAPPNSYTVPPSIPISHWSCR